MATIKTRRRANGETRYTAIVRIREGKSVIHSEAKTFTYRSAASSWAKNREVALENPEELQRAREQKDTNADSYLLGKLIRWYIDEFRKIGKWQRTKQSTLEFLERHPIGGRDVRKLTSAHLVQHVQARREAGAGPSTVSNDLIYLGVVLRAAKSVKEIAIKPAIVDEARTACRALKLIAKSRRRDRRPTEEELAKLDAYFSRRDRRSKVPMRDIWNFALESAKREAEICRILWKDNDEVARTGIVRDAKHPRQKEGNHKTFKYTREAWAIVQRQPRTSERIFPYDPKSVSAGFTRSCKVLGIEDLRFHDGRHEATSRLFERGYHIQEVAQFTSHESWNELKRYTHLRPKDLREIPAGSKVGARGQANRPSAAAGRSLRRGRPRSPATETSAPQA